ncbi:alpha/beta hydrolase [Mycolicibacterium boenickei]
MPIYVEDDLPDGPADHTVVLLHGLCLSHRSWHNQVRRLRQTHHRVIRYDHRGHSRSGSAPRATYTLERLAADLAETLTALSVSGPTTFVGHSMGGMVALTYLCKPSARPLLPHGLVLVGTAAGGIAERGIGRLLATPGLSSVLAAMEHLPHRASERIVHTLVRPLCDLLTRDGSLSAGFCEAVYSTPATTAIALLAAIKTYDQRQNLPRISATTTIISGGLDALTPSAHSDEMANAISGAVHVHRPRAGHMLLHEASDTVSDAILRTATHHVASTTAYLPAPA